ncbi:MAG: 3'-5' exonuclease, partial [Anaerolineales bacterium]
MTSLVALDIETTGLDPQRDAIIEIGAVRFNESRVEDQWTTLIHPGRTIPPFITQLTGINDQMVIKAPPISAVLTDLIHFIDDAPILGHNVGFDISFLRKQKKNLFGENEVVDSYELAAVLMPTAGRYSLGALATALGVPFPATHRALDDAHATRGVYLQLMEEANQLPIRILAEIIRLSDPIDWGGYWFFRKVLRERSKEIVSAEQVRHAYTGPLFEERYIQPSAPLQPLTPPSP